MTTQTLQYETGTLQRPTVIEPSNSSEQPFISPDWSSDTKIWNDRAMPGVVELDWFHRHVHQMTNYRGLWVAILEHRLVATGQTFQHVYDNLTATGIDNALVIRVPDEDPNRRPYLIA